MSPKAITTHRLRTVVLNAYSYVIRTSSKKKVKEKNECQIDKYLKLNIVKLLSAKKNERTFFLSH